ncbi:hypothetical protein [Terasakiella sp.]|uniref:hypothetical protein n=1 Tax=Terasakiella sp. TaxID=2034861 RepID=UPI003AA9ACBF
MLILHFFLFLLSLTISTQAVLAAEIATPFGFEIGVDTLHSSKTKVIEARSTMKNIGTNKYSHGPVYEVDVSHIAVKDIKTIQLIFDAKDHLQGITFNSSKHNFKSLEDHVASKYQLSRREVPFVGNKFAEYKAPNAIIQLDAPHMSFQMSISYVSTDLLKSFSKTVQENNQAQKKKEASQF